MIPEHADPRNTPSLLPLGGERRGEEGASGQPEEGTPLHHSIT
jgi:hypothetical protein